MVTVLATMTVTTILLRLKHEQSHSSPVCTSLETRVLSQRGEVI